MTSAYIGRFAPSPTGPLHFGSLVAALASFLDARSHGGTWLVRMEDLDPPREPPGAAAEILRQLESLRLYWDGEVLYQSTRLASYQQALDQLQSAGHCFYCDCSRARLRELGGNYDGHCRTRIRVENDSQSYALRLNCQAQQAEFTDTIQGFCRFALDECGGDFVIRRKDRLFAYQLAVVVDDAFQQITHVVRGSDLLDSTPRQIVLQRLLGLPTPHYGHIPVAVDASGSKLSKQQFAEPLSLDSAQAHLLAALRFLGQQPPSDLVGSNSEQLLAWAIEHWNIQAVPKLATIPAKS